MKRLFIYLCFLPLALVIAAAPGKVVAWTAAFILLAVLVLLAIWGYVSNERIKREKLSKVYASRFVYIEDTGSARELTAEEADYMNAEFHPADGARPYIKSKYAQRAPNGRLGGFLLKSKLPRTIQPSTAAASHVSTDA